MARPSRWSWAGRGRCSTPHPLPVHRPTLRIARSASRVGLQRSGGHAEAKPGKGDTQEETKHRVAYGERTVEAAEPIVEPADQERPENHPQKTRAKEHDGYGGRAPSPGRHGAHGGGGWCFVARGGEGRGAEGPSSTA